MNGSAAPASSRCRIVAARAARAVLSRRAARRRTAAFRSRDLHERLAESRRLERSAVPHRFRLDARPSAGEEEAAEPNVAREPVRLRGLRGVLRLERNARPTGDAHGPRPRSRRGALRDLPCVCQHAGADHGRAVAPAGARVVRAVRPCSDRRALDPRIAAAGVSAPHSPEHSSGAVIPRSWRRRAAGLRSRAST